MTFVPIDVLVQGSQLFTRLEKASVSASVVVVKDVLPLALIPPDFSVSSGRLQFGWQIGAEEVIRLKSSHLIHHFGCVISWRCCLDSSAWQCFFGGWLQLTTRRLEYGSTLNVGCDGRDADGDRQCRASVSARIRKHARDHPGAHLEHVSYFTVVFLSVLQTTQQQGMLMASSLIGIVLGRSGNAAWGLQSCCGRTDLGHRLGFSH